MNCGRFASSVPPGLRSGLNKLLRCGCDVGTLREVGGIIIRCCLLRGSPPSSRIPPPAPDELELTLEWADGGEVEEERALMWADKDMLEVGGEASGGGSELSKPV